MFKIKWIYVSLVLLVCLLILKIYYHNTDVSLYKVKNSNRTYSDQKIWLISFASEGIHIQNQNNLMMSASIYQAFDVIIPYQPHHIEPEYYKKHKEILSQKRGAGYWLWKPYFILKTLNLMAENDILLYLDSSSVLRDGIYGLLELGKKHDITVFPNFHNNRGYVKRTIIKKITNDDSSILDKVQIEGNILLLKNTKSTREIVKEWLEYSEDPALLTDVSSEEEFLDFKDNRHDQAILSVMYHKNPKGFNLYEAYPARMESVIVTRRKNQCSMIPVTFNNKTKFTWWDNLKYRSIIWLIGCQRFKGH
ncbi:MAG: hypothetical protein AABY27_05025 [Pseudomonadota bacterium]